VTRGSAERGQARPGAERGQAQTGAEARHTLARRLRFQADASARLGSPLYADLLGHAADDVVTGDAVYGVLERDELRRLVENPVQTNEPGRCAALLGGFLELARATGLPLRLLEVGTSAGLNLRFDRYRYELGGERWGPAASPVVIRTRLAGAGRPPLDTPLRIASRAGCDTRPVDARSEEGRLTLTSYVWPDQVERLERLRAALAVAREVDAPVERAGAADWIEARLAEPAPGTATVVFHSIVMQYLPEDERERFERAVRNASDGVAWLRMEPADEAADVRLRLGEEDRLIARAGYHGAFLDWLG
jgi:hypothetical protein